MAGRNSVSQASNSNDAQVEVTLDIVKGFLKGHFAVKDIAILCTYKEQVKLYEKELKGDAMLSELSVRTVDASQGSEWPLVILNTVRTGEDALGHTIDRRRLKCVAY